MLKTYLEHIQRVVETFGEAPFVVETSIDVDLRPGSQAYITGRFSFLDGSVLHFREYVDASGTSVEKVSYTYHYQDATHAMIFRYDNARHRPSLGFRQHKHTSHSVIAASAPSLEAVLLEIVEMRKFTQ